MAENRMNYTNRDLASIRQELINQIPKLTSNWTDYNESDIGIVFIEFLAGVADMLNFYMDQQSLECFLYSSVQEKNIRSILRNMNYPIPLLSSARWAVQIKTAAPLESSVTIPRYTQVMSEKGIAYTVLEDTTLSSDNSEFSVSLEQGTTVTISTTVGILKQSRRFYLNDNKVSRGSLSMYVPGNYIWEEVDDALTMFEGGSFYSLHKDNLGQVYILFTPDWQDILPLDDSATVVFRYVQTSGKAAMISGDNITAFPYLETLGIEVSEVKCLSDKSYGATDEIPLQALKPIAQRYMKVMDRYITLEDYETRVLQEPYIVSCVALDWKTSEYVPLPYQVFIWAVDSEGNDFYDMPAYSEPLFADLASKGICINTPTLQQTTFVPLNISVTATITGKKAVQDRLKAEIEELIAIKYKPENLRHGQRFSFAELSSEIRSLSGDIVDLELTPDNDIEIDKTSFLRLGEVSVSVVERQ